MGLDCAFTAQRFDSDIQKIQKAIARGAGRNVIDFTKEITTYLHFATVEADSVRLWGKFRFFSAQTNN